MRTLGDIHLLGVSFRTAPSAVREALAFDHEQATALLRQAGAAIPGLEAMVLSTCNRTELYVVEARGSGALERFHGLVRRAMPGAPIFDESCWRYERAGAEAMRHLVTVACGLDSAILGDEQILSQLRAARATAADSGTLGKLLTKSVGIAIRCGKRARAETDIARGTAGIGSAVAATIAAHEWLSPAASPAVVLLGTGEAARSIGRHLAKAGYRDVTIVGRSVERARAAAAHCGGTALAWPEIDAALDRADAVIAATAAKTPVLGREQLAAALVRRSDRRPPVVVDAGFPANVEAGSPVAVIPLEEIREGEESVLAARRAAVPAVTALVEVTVEDWRRWAAGSHLDGVIGHLHADAERVCRETAAALAAPLDLDHAERILRRSMGRLLHSHVTRLRTLAADMEAAS